MTSVNDDIPVLPIRTNLTNANKTEQVQEGV